MQTFTITKGAASVILPISIYDSSSTTGAKLAGLVYNTASLTAYYNRSGAAGAATAITLATATKGTWATGGFIAIDGTNMPGDYELHIPDAALATGADTVLIQLKGATNMVPKNILIRLQAVNMQDGVRAGLTGLANATAGGAGGLPIVGAGTNNFKSDASANVTFANTSIATVTTLTNLPAITANWLTAAGIDAGALNGKGDWNVGKTGYSLTQTFPANFSSLSISVTTGLVDVTQTAADKVWATTTRAITDKAGFSLSSAGVQAIWDALTSALTTVGSIGKLCVDNINAAISSRMATYTQPTGFLAATFPTGTIANTTNITAGTVATATNVTTVNGLAAGVVTAASIAATALNGKGDWNIGKTGYVLDVTERNAVADALLDRNMATGTDSGSPTVRTVRQSLRFLRNKWSLSGATLTVTKEDDATSSWTATVSTDAAALPITGNDPA